MNGQRQIVFFVTDEFQGLDLFGPVDAFDAARVLAGANYSLCVAGFDTAPVRTEAGVAVAPQARLDDLDEIDTLVVCGGRGGRTGRFATDQISMLSRAAARARRVASICTGAFLVVRTGIADGRTIATHWRYAPELARRYPDTRVDADSIFVHDGKLWSSAGVTAGIDLSLALIARDCGKPAAASVARQLVMYMHRAGNQAQYSDPLVAQSHSAGRFGELLHWVTNHLSEPLTVERMAERVGVTPRHFTRLFRQSFGITPARYIENLRLDRARSLLCEPNARIERVAVAVGYQSAPAFRRAFERRFSMTPREYRARFETPPLEETQ